MARSSVDHVSEKFCQFWSGSCWKHASLIHIGCGVSNFHLREAGIASKEKLRMAEMRSLRNGPGTFPGLVQKLANHMRCLGFMYRPRLVIWVPVPPVFGLTYVDVRHCMIRTATFAVD